MLKLLKAYPRLALTLVFYALIASLLGLSIPLGGQLIVGQLIESASTSVLMTLAIGLFFILILRIFVLQAELDAVEELSRRTFVDVAAWVHQRFDGFKLPSSHLFFEAVVSEKSVAALLFDGLNAALSFLAAMALLAFYDIFFLGFGVVLFALALLCFGIFLALGKSSAQQECSAKHKLALQYKEDTKERANDIENWWQARAKHYGVVRKQFVFAVGVQTFAIVTLFGFGGALVLQNRLPLGQLVAAEVAVAMAGIGLVKFFKTFTKFFDLSASLHKLESSFSRGGSMRFGATREDSFRGPLKASFLFKWPALVLLLAALTLMAFLPWTRTAFANGQVIVTSPDKRPRTFSAPFDGVVASWKVLDGATISKNQVLVDFKAIDPMQRARAVRQVEESQNAENELRRAAEAVQEEIKATESAMQAKVDALRSEERSSRFGVEVEKESVEAALVAQDVAVKNRERNVSLEQEGLTSARKREVSEQAEAYAKRQYKQSLAKKEKALAKRRAQESKVYQAIAERAAKLASLRTKLAEVEQKITKATTDRIKFESQLAIQESDLLSAPYEGTLVWISPKAIGAVVKKGEPLFQIAPFDADKSVEVWVQGRDASLIEKNALVRIQFQGWPAFQLASFPQIAVGLFEGKVSQISPMADTQGRVRLIVNPISDEAWPIAPYLPVGGKLSAYVSLGDVPLYQEIWRRLNSLPIPVAVPSKDAPSDDAKKATQMKAKKS